MGLDFGAYSAAGSRYGTLNQDYAVVRDAFTAKDLADRPGVPQCCVAAVLDGHGMLGELVAKACGDALVDDVIARTRRCDRWLDQPQDKLRGALSAAFDKAHQAGLAVYDDPPSRITYPCSTRGCTPYSLQRASSLPVYRSEAAAGGGGQHDRLLECGTTCTLAILQGDAIAVAHVGDSAAVLVRLREDDTVEARFITVDHNGRNVSEADRIDKSHARTTSICRHRGYMRVVSGIWAGFELSVTRSLGHKNLEAHGVLCEPDVTRLALAPNDACLIIASDGVWDVMDAREAAHRVLDVLSAGGSAADAARQLVTDTVMLAEGSPDGDADNTTAVVVVLGE